MKRRGPEEEAGRPGGRGLAQIHEEKTALLRVGRGEVEFDLREASLALGVSAYILNETLLVARSGLIVAAGSSEDTVVLRVEDFYPGRDLWHEVLETLERGRSETGAKRDLYETLFILGKLISGGGEEMVGELSVKPNLPPRVAKIVTSAQAGCSPQDLDLIDIQKLATIVFLDLPGGMQEELKGDGRSPDFFSS